MEFKECISTKLVRNLFQPLSKTRNISGFFYHSSVIPDLRLVFCPKVRTETLLNRTNFELKNRKTVQFEANGLRKNKDSEQASVGAF